MMALADHEALPVSRGNRAVTPCRYVSTTTAVAVLGGYAHYQGEMPVCCLPVSRERSSGDVHELGGLGTFAANGWPMTLPCHTLRRMHSSRRQLEQIFGRVDAGSALLLHSDGIVISCYIFLCRSSGSGTSAVSLDTGWNEVCCRAIGVHVVRADCRWLGACSSAMGGFFIPVFVRGMTCGR